MAEASLRCGDVRGGWGAFDVVLFGMLRDANEHLILKAGRALLKGMGWHVCALLCD